MLNKKQTKIGGKGELVKDTATPKKIKIRGCNKFKNNYINYI